MKKFSLLLITIFSLLFSIEGKAQKDFENLNYYKYVVIPVKFEFQDKDNEYLLNSLIKHLLKENQFNTYMDVEKKPKDLTFNRCLALFVEVETQSESFFSLVTKLEIALKDCTGKVVFKSEGTSKMKKIKAAYQDAIRDAFKVYGTFDYIYNGKNSFNISDKYISETEPSVNENDEVQESKNVPVLMLEGNYTMEDKNYEVKKIEAGYILKHTNTGKREAFINETSNNSILYNSDKINGTLTVNEQNNLMVEYFNKTSGRLEKIVFTRVD